MFRVFETPKLLVIELELMDRKNLHELLQAAPQGRLPEGRAADVAVGLVQALLALRRQGICHRDLKLSNLVLARGFGERFHSLSSPELRAGLRLIDFGMAAYADAAGRLTGRCGTPGYVAPEILCSKPGAGYEANVDMFSVGVILFTLLCGFEPFQREDVAHTLRANRDCDFGFPPAARVSPQAQAFVRALLVTDPARRLDPRAALEHPWLRPGGPRSAAAAGATDLATAWAEPGPADGGRKRREPQHRSQSQERGRETSSARAPKEALGRPDSHHSPAPPLCLLS